MGRSVVIIGGGVGGLSAAIYARLRGYDVLLLERGEQTGGKAASVRRAGYRLDPGPSIVILPRIYAALFKDAGRKMDDYLRFRRLDPVSHVRVEGGPTFDLPAGRQACLDRVADIAPNDASAFADLLNLLDRVAPHIDRSVFAHPYDRIWQLADPHLLAMAACFDVRATYKELVDRRFQSPLLRAFFYGFPSYGGQTYDSRAPGALMIPYLMVNEGVFYPEGGVGAIPESLSRLAIELGVEVRTGVKVTALRARPSGRITAAVLEDGEEVVADAFISNVDRSTTREWLGHREDVRPSFSYYTVQWGIRRQYPGLGHHTLLIPKSFEAGFEGLYRRRTFPDPPIIYVNSPGATDPDSAPPGCSTLFGVITSPADEPSVGWAANANVFRDHLMSGLSRFGFEIRPEEVEFERIQNPEYFAREHGNYRGSLYGVDEPDRLFGGLFPRSNRDSEHANLYYCGGSVQPGAGLPMVTLSGKFAAQMLRI